MDRKTITNHGVGTVLAHKNRFNGYHTAVRLMDTGLWRRTTHANRAPHLNRAHGESKCGPTVGYPVLRILAPGSLSEDRQAELAETLRTTTLTITDVLNADGTINYDVLPSDIGVDIVHSRYLTSTWEQHLAVEAAERAEYDAQVAADLARYATQDAARKERQVQLENAREAARAQCRILTGALARLDITSGGISPKLDFVGDAVRIEINMDAVAALVERLAVASARIDDTNATVTPYTFD